MMYMRVIVTVFSLVTMTSLSACQDQDTDLREERRSVSDAVQKMGGGAGISFILMNEGNGKVHNQIELTFRGLKNINDENVKHLAGLKSVVGIDLSETAITDDGLEILSSLPDLEYLQLGDTAITNSGLTFLKECAILKRLDVRRTPIRANAIEILNEFPALEIVHAKGTELESSDLVDIDKELHPHFKIQEEK